MGNYDDRFPGPSAGTSRECEDFGAIFFSSLDVALRFRGQFKFIISGLASFGYPSFSPGLLIRFAGVRVNDRLGISISAVLVV